MADLIRPIPGTETQPRAPATLGAGAEISYDFDLSSITEAKLIADVIPSTGGPTSIRLFQALNTKFSNIPTESWSIRTANIPSIPSGQTSVIISIHIHGPFHYRVHFNNDDGAAATGLISLDVRDAQREQITEAYP